MISDSKRWMTLLLLLAAGLAHAGERLVIGVEDIYYLPLANYEKGTYQGFARELFDAFARDRGYTVEYRALPVPRLYATFFAGQVDFKFPDNAYWKKEQRTRLTIHYSEPVASFVDGTSVLPALRHAAAEDIRQLGTLAGFTPWAWLDRIKAGGVKLSENTQLEALVRQALTGRVDGVYASVAVINYQLDKVLGMPGALVFNAALPHTRDTYHLATLTKPRVISEFNDWLRRNRDRVAALKLRHGVEKGVPGR
ncbi:MAG: transporter substrate-binding domain-containing protein [Pseudomonadota bacterium]